MIQFDPHVQAKIHPPLLQKLELPAFNSRIAPSRASSATWPAAPSNLLPRTIRQSWNWQGFLNRLVEERERSRECLPIVWIFPTNLNAKRLPRHILKAVRDSRPSETEIYALIHAIEPGPTTPCERIDSEGILVLCWTFLHSMPCLAQQRGLCLIAVGHATFPETLRMLTWGRNHCIITDLIHLRRQP